MCACDAGYRGVNCDVEVDECSVFAPCQFGARCIDMIADYQCICEEYLGLQYGGKNCSVVLTGCEMNQCQSGQCVPILLSEDPVQHSYYCDCPQGISGQFCEKNTTASFFGNSWLRYDETDNFADLNLSLRFQTTLPNGLLMVNVKENINTGSNDYVLLQLVGGSTIQLDYVNQVQGPLVLSVTPGMSIADGDWHNVNVTIHNTGITLVLQHASCQNGECKDTKPFSGDEVDSKHHTLGYTWFGGSDLELGFVSDAAQFTGCMQDISTFDVIIIPSDYIGNSTASKNIADGCARVDQCSTDPCNSHGNCTDLWFEYNCSCWRPYLGENCNQGKHPSPWQTVFNKI